MKTSLKWAVLTMAIALMTVGCNHSDIKGFEKTPSGLHYKFESLNEHNQQVMMGDALICNIKLSLEDVVLDSGLSAMRYNVRTPLFDGDLPEGIMMMHNGDKAVFAVEADSVAKFFPDMMPQNYKSGKKMKFYYEVTALDIISKEELDQELENQMYPMMIENDRIAQYIADNEIDEQPDSTGLYVIVTKKGNGKAIETGRQVKLNYSGYLLDGTLYNTSEEEVAKEAGVLNPNRKYKPLAYTVGDIQFIEGWSKGLMGQTQGSEVTLIIPSSLAYGAQGFREDIGPYEPLVIKIQILEVR